MARFIFILLLAIVSCKPTSVVVKKELQQYEITKVNIDSNTQIVIAPYKTKMDAIMNEVIGHSQTVMEKNIPESTLGNFVADAILNQAKKHTTTPIDFVFLNNGGLRSALPFGEITMGNVYSLMPFDNEVVLLTLSGAQTKELIQFIIDKGGVPVAGIRIIIKNKLPYQVMIGNQKMDESKTYNLLTSDYLANGGDKLEMLRMVNQRQNLNLLLRNLIVDEFRQQEKSGIKVFPKLDNRISYE
ncbi:MAG: 5'-nucleotidase C-terminal domain-containing protein [Bacteroidia bacterium]|nr:5'-nucleotidase C-terminal domain-containing protein [Bacteroidia bacterium]HQV00886.1 5'-nucleotidase [Bacteroidia bacterium]